MRARASLALLAALAVPAGCAGGSQTEAANDAAVCSAFNGGQSQVEVIADGTVTRVFGTRSGRTSPHEGFLMKLASGCNVIVRVEANTDFTGEFPIREGDAVTVKGEYEYYPRGGVIHWTHRDPRGRHQRGYITVEGKTYG